MNLQQLEEQEYGEPTPRRVSVKRNIYAEPVNKYDYCAIMARITGKPIGFVLGRTKSWPLHWFHEIYSYCKTYRDETAKRKYIFWMLREGRVK